MKTIYTVRVSAGHCEGSVGIGVFIREEQALDLAKKWNNTKRVKSDGSKCDFFGDAVVYASEVMDGYCDVVAIPDEQMFYFKIQKGRKAYTKRQKTNDL